MDAQARKAEIRVQLAWAVICLAVAVGLWGYAFDLMDGAFLRSGYGYLAAGLFVLFINATHFVWGAFHVEDEISDVDPGQGPGMVAWGEGIGIVARVVGILTVGPSAYLRQAIRLSRHARPPGP
jgi:hypothetical protein